MTRTGRFLRGLGVGYASQVLTTLVGLWLTTFLLAQLGQSDYGLWLVATQVLSYLLLLDLGVVALLPREVAFATGRAGSVKDAEDLPTIVGERTTLVLWQLPLVATIAILVWLFFPETWAPLRTPMAVVMAAFVVTFPLRILRAALEGLQDLAFLGITNTVSWILGTVTTILLVLAGFGLFALAVGWIVGQVAAASAWWVRLRRRFPTAARVAPVALDRPRTKERMTGSLWISMQQIAQVLLYGTDLLIIGRVLGPAAVVPYFVTAKLMLVLANQPLMLIQTAGPGLSEVRAGQPPERVAEVSTALMQAMLMISGGIVCVVLVVNQSFVGWWVGSERFGGIALTAVLLAGMFLRHVNTTLVYTLFAFGHDRRISITTLGDGLLTVATSVVLVLVMGPIGAAIGSVVGVSVVSLPGNLPALFRDTGITPTRMARSLWPWFWRFAVLATGASVVAASPVPTSLIFVVSVAAGGAIAYGLVMLPLAVRDPLGIYVRPRWETLKTRLSWS